MYGKHHKKETIKKISESKIGNKNPHWSNNIGYSGIHRRIKMILPKPNLCMKCNDRKAMDLANISGEYKEDISDWEWLCRYCHMVTDGRINNLRQFRDMKYG